jgi:hypothetical protein
MVYGIRFRVRMKAACGQLNIGHDIVTSLEKGSKPESSTLYILKVEP